jgi:hypothetical protein
MAETLKNGFCALLRTKTAYFRSHDGERLFDPESTTACYNCLVTQRPFGPHGMPVNAEWCRQTARASSQRPKLQARE